MNTNNYNKLQHINTVLGGVVTWDDKENTYSYLGHTFHSVQQVVAHAIKEGVIDIDTIINMWYYN